MSRAGTAATVVAAVALFSGAVGVQAARERLYPPPDTAEDVLYVTSPALARRLALSYDALAADVYWIRTIQYYGGARRRLTEAMRLGLLPPPALAADVSDYDLLYRLLDLTTSLDPRFKIAYHFGATFLAETYPDGAGRPDLAIALLEKGLQAQPDSWSYMEDIGFVHYWWLHDYTAAARWFNQAADVPGAPWWLRSLAATTLAAGGDRQSSRRMWQTIHETAEIDWLRRDSERRLRQLDAMDQIDRLQALVDAYTARTGAPPSDWRALPRGGPIRGGVPLDPGGVPYQLRDGRVGLSNASPLYPLPEEPAASAPPVPAP
jgi:hypothetical protein